MALKTFTYKTNILKKAYRQWVITIDGIEGGFSTKREAKTYLDNLKNRLISEPFTTQSISH